MLGASLERNVSFVFAHPVLFAVEMQQHCLPVPAAGLGRRVGLAAVGALPVSWGWENIVRNVRKSETARNQQFTVGRCSDVRTMLLPTTVRRPNIVRRIVRHFVRT